MDRRFFRQIFLTIPFPCLSLLTACHGTARVEFVSGQCLVDGFPATLAQVEAHQAAVAGHVLSRQPLFVLVTLLVVVLAGISHIEKLMLLLSAGRADVKGLGERLRIALDKYRAHPVRYFGIVAGTLGLLVLTAGAYIYMDADKRASERALGMLQFCQLTLRAQGERAALDEQRHNLESIRATAGDIRTLVAKLPPDEQQKAHEIIDQLNAALGEQGKLVADYLQRTNDSYRTVRERTQAVEHGLSTLEADVLTLKSLPAGLHDLSVELHGTHARLESVDNKLGGLSGKLDALDGRLNGLDNRLGGVDGKLGGLDGKLGGLDGKLGGLDGKLGGLDGKLGGLDGKLGGCEARLTALEAAVKALSRAEKDPPPPPHAPGGGQPKPTP